MDHFINVGERKRVGTVLKLFSLLEKVYYLKILGETRGRDLGEVIDVWNARDSPTVCRQIEQRSS